jgi:hypothetical protein
MDNVDVAGLSWNNDELAIFRDAVAPSDLIRSQASSLSRAAIVGADLGTELMCVRYRDCIQCCRSWMSCGDTAIAPQANRLH